MATNKEAGDPLSHNELSEVLADATGTTPAELDREAEAIDIESPDDAEIVSE